MHSAVALAVFVTAYVLFVMLPKYRAWVAVAGALALMLAGVVSPALAFLGEGSKESLISWNVMGIFVGTLILADLFIWSRVPHYVAERLVNRSRSVCWAMVKVCAFSGFLSIFTENVAVVLIVAPIAFALAEKLKTSPVPLIIGVTVSSNLQGTATLIGDPASMIFAEYANVSFNDFFWYKGQGLGVFFAIQFGFLTSLPVLYWAFRYLNQKVKLVAEERVISWGPTIFLATMMLALAMASSLEAHNLLGAICMLWGLGGLAWYELWGRHDRERFPDTPWQILRRLDWDSALFLMGVFVIVGAVVEQGWIDLLADWLKSVLGADLFVAYVTIIFLSMLVSAFVDNIPYLMAMIPLVMKLAAPGAGQEALLFGLLIAASLGGNITPIGASANIVGAGQLRQRGYILGFREFGRIGLPFTLAATIPAAIFLYLLWVIL
ncbi:MAG: SLC13 family permease [Candidatus Bipolaricaulota bacterium]|nr:SLC13 family permease [Candidatus Bipolaricaulota bacterium]MDW8031719.1 SLC13 family permease [Candidatus Bipolaricaulota bacterium]